MKGLFCVLSILLLCLSFNSSTQYGSVKGMIFDNQEKTPLPGATIVFIVSIISNGLPKPDFLRGMNKEENTDEMSCGIEGGSRGGMHGGGRGSFEGGRYGGELRQESSNDASDNKGNLETHKIVVNIKLATRN